MYKATITKFTAKNTSFLVVFCERAGLICLCLLLAIGTVGGPARDLPHGFILGGAGLLTTMMLGALVIGAIEFNKLLEDIWMKSNGQARCIGHSYKFSGANSHVELIHHDSFGFQRGARFHHLTIYRPPRSFSIGGSAHDFRRWCQGDCSHLSPDQIWFGR